MSDTLTASEEYSIAQVGKEMLATSTPHQKALLRFLAICQNYGVNPADGVEALGLELGSAQRLRFFDLADRLESKSVSEALLNTEHSVSPQCSLAIQLAEQNNQTQQLFNVLHDASLVRDPIDDSPNQGKLFRLSLKTLVMTCLLVFFANSLVPELKDMLDEFEISPTPVLVLFISSLKYLSLVILVYLLMVGLVLFLRGNLLRRFLSRWNPNRWRERVVGKKISGLKELAMICQFPNGFIGPALNKEDDDLLKARYPQVAQLAKSKDIWAEARRMKLIPPKVYNALEKTKSDQTKAWLLNWQAENRSSRKEASDHRYLYTVISITNVVFAIYVFLAAVAVFGTMVAIVQELL